MSAAATGETFNIRHRLIGAFVLIASAVIVLPLILNGEKAEPIAVDITTPSEQRAPREFVSRIQPMGETQKKVVETADGQHIQFNPVTENADENTNAPVNAAAPAQSAPAPEQPAAQADEPEPQAPAQPAVAKAPVERVTANTPKPKSAEQPKPVVKKTTSAKAPTKTAKVAEKAPSTPSSLSVETDRGWIVSIGVFGDPANVTRNIALLKAKEFSPRTTRHKSKDGKVTTRVWVGPYEQRVTAGRIQDRIESAIGERGFIMAYP